MNKTQIINKMQDLTESIRNSQVESGEIILKYEHDSRDTLRFFTFHFHPSLVKEIREFVNNYLEVKMRQSNQLFKDELKQMEKQFIECSENE